MPIKALAKALNATVDWVPEKNTITITHNDSTLGIPYKDDEDDDKKGEDDDKKSKKKQDNIEQDKNIGYLHAFAI